MKNQLILALALTLTLSCGKDKAVENVKLLEYVTDDAGDLIEKFEYDDKNRIVKMISYNNNDSSTTAITYNTDDLVTVMNRDTTAKYVKKGNTITSESDTLTINKDGYIVEKKDKSGAYTYQYQDGNMTELKGNEEDRSFSYSNFDDKKSPFSNSNTPKWLIQLLSFRGHKLLDNKNNVNNVLKKYGPFSCNADYTYEYNSEGFPIKQTAIVDDYLEMGYCGQTEILHFIYPGRTAEEIAAFDAARQVVKKERLAAEKAAEEAKKAAEEAEEAAEKALAKYIKPEKDKASKEGRIFTDNRDGKTYMWVKIGAQTWMAENLNYEAAASECYDGSERRCRMYGSLYYYSDDVCPSGWHLPSRDEWRTLVDFAGGEKVAGKRLKAKSGGWNGTNDYGFLALPGGYADQGDFVHFSEVGFCGKWWLADDQGPVYINGEDAFQEAEASAAVSLYSVRCVKDEEKTSETEITQ